MPVQYTNRVGDTYYLQAGRTRTGKPRYWFGRKLTGEPVESVPAGYEIYEHPKKGLVTLRKTKPTKISAQQRDLVCEGIRRYAGLEHFAVDVQGDSLVVYLPDTSGDAVDRMVTNLGGPGLVPSSRVQEAKARLVRTSDYMKMMRFILVNPDKRAFAPQRWCFRGSVDDWINIGPPGPLEVLVRKYAPHLGEESFDELM